MTCDHCGSECQGFGNYYIVDGDVRCDSCHDILIDEANSEWGWDKNEIPNCACGCNKPAAGCKGNCRFGVEDLCGHCLPNGLYPCELVETP